MKTWMFRDDDYNEHFVKPISLVLHLHIIKMLTIFISFLKTESQDWQNNGMASGIAWFKQLFGSHVAFVVNIEK